MKKKAVMWSTIGRILIVLATLVILLFILYKITGQSFGLIEKIKQLFGG